MFQKWNGGHTLSGKHPKMINMCKQIHLNRRHDEFPEFMKRWEIALSVKTARKTRILIRIEWTTFSGAVTKAFAFFDLSAYNNVGQVCLQTNATFDTVCYYIPFIVLLSSSSRHWALIQCVRIPIYWLQFMIGSRPKPNPKPSSWTPFRDFSIS